MKGERVLRTLPEATQGILHGIMEKMLAISAKLHVGFIPNDTKGFRIRYKRCLFYDIAIYGHIAYMKNCGRTKHWQGGGCNTCDLRNQKQFSRWLENLLDGLESHVNELIESHGKCIVPWFKFSWDVIECEVK